MTDHVTDATASLKAWRVPVSKGSAGDVADKLVQELHARKIDALVLDSRLVFGTDHIRSALYHARKAISEKRNVSDSLAMEALLYASGERQLSAAIRKMSPGDSTTELVVARLSTGDLPTQPGWSELPPVIDDPPHDRLAEFGISSAELGTCPVERAIDLVLEKVAAVDVIKK